MADVALDKDSADSFLGQYTGRSATVAPAAEIRFDT